MISCYEYPMCICYIKTRYYNLKMKSKKQSPKLPLLHRTEFSFPSELLGIEHDLHHNLNLDLDLRGKLSQCLGSFRFYSRVDLSSTFFKAHFTFRKLIWHERTIMLTDTVCVILWFLKGNVFVFKQQREASLRRLRKTVFSFGQTISMDIV